MKEKKGGSHQHTSIDILDQRWIEVNIPCRTACPIQTDIPGYIQAIMEGDYRKAYYINRMDNVLPGILGRVCHRPCEDVCRHGWDGLGDPVSICFLKRSAADYGDHSLKQAIVSLDKKVCIIGAGPAGLTAANDLALKGYQVTILEQYDQPGGMLRYGIPQFRLPHQVVEKDVKSITDLGVEIQTGQRIENPEQIEELKRKYDAVLVAGGCQLSKEIPIPGIELPGVILGLDFMMETNQERLDRPLGKVVVIGGGFTAIDCVRMAYRLRAEAVTLAYRRTKDDMVASKEEVQALEAEDIDLHFLVSPVRIIANKDKVKEIEFRHNSINLKDRSITPIRDSEFTLEADTIVFAIGQDAETNLLIRAGGKDKKENFFQAGDFRNGASTVIEAAADGRRVAGSVHQFLSGNKKPKTRVRMQEITETGRPRDYDFIPRQPMEEIPPYERKEKNKEVELGFSQERALVESRRCYLCHYNFQIDIERCIYCLACIDVMPVNCIKMAKDIKIGENGDLEYLGTSRWDEVQAITIDNDQCIRCGNCVRACPVDCISISKYSLEEVEK